MYLNSDVTISKRKISCLLMFFYIFLCCLNQYVKLFGLPLFIYLLLIYCIVEIYFNDFIISKPFTQINKMSDWYFYFFCLWIFVGFSFTIYINNKESWRNLLYLFINILGCYIVFYEVYNYDSVRKWCYKGIVLGTLTNIFVAFWELKYSKHIVPLTADYLRRFANRPLGFYPNTNDLAVILFFLLAVLTVGFIFNRNLIRNKATYIILAVSACTVIFKTKSILTITATICFLIFPWLYYKYRKKKNLIYFILFIILLVPFIILTFNGELYLSKFHLSIDEETFTGRIDIWINTWKSFKSSYFIGIGPGQSIIKGYGSVHNLFLEVIVEYGLVIGVIFILLYISVLKNIIRLNRSYLNSTVVIFALLFLPISICSSTMTKLFIIWPSIGILLALTLKDHEREVCNYDTNSSTDISD